ncbi:hypothetical protein ABI_17920 [Asticcacaulis biprosthecium C19]|uniref:Uncharacterized protein n=1 Tax=Asticcacaulis biprosthecium C19 TaxID=715226 RepID=F4QKQ0_9CAUL|nr:hypothetical protein ABI_17920 [Asticcacaulis biprosthecium C19]
MDPLAYEYSASRAFRMNRKTGVPKPIKRFTWQSTVKVTV